MPKVQLVITFDPQDGQTAVSGPINNKPLCYGMLECARDAIQKFSARDEEMDRGEGPRIIVPKGPLPSEDGS